jgi:hypothetical protein
MRNVSECLNLEAKDDVLFMFVLGVMSLRTIRIWRATLIYSDFLVHDQAVPFMTASLACEQGVSS